MGNSPRPEVFALERSSDHGKTWQPWQFFADTRSNCELFFGRFGYTDRIDRDDAVLCKTGYSNVVPLEGGEVCDLMTPLLGESAVRCPGQLRCPSPLKRKQRLKFAV